MKNYALELLETALRDELKAREDGLEILNGGRGYYHNDGRQAFIDSKALADERIPQLQEAISKINS